MGLNASDFIGQTLLSFDGGSLTIGDLLLVVTVLIATFLFSRYVRGFLDRRVLDKREVDRNFKFLMMRITHYVILLIGFLIALNLVGIQLTALLAVAGVAGLALGFGLQTIISNFVSGMIIMAERKVKVGDIIEVGGQVGEVTKVETRATTINTFDNASILVPNENFIAEEVTNWSHGDPKVRIHVPVGVAYGSDVEKVREVLVDIARKDPEVISYTEPTVWFESFGDSALNFKLLAWINHPRKRKETISRLNFEIDRRFREEGITIPYPQRDLWFKGDWKKATDDRDGF